MNKPEKPEKPYDNSDVRDYELIVKTTILETLVIPDHLSGMAIDYDATESYDEPDESIVLHDEYLDQWKRRKGWKEGDVLPVAISSNYNTEVFSLADVLAKVPDGISPEDVSISFRHDRMMDYLSVSVDFKNHLDKDDLKRKKKEQYKQEMAKYKAELVQYKTDLAAYKQYQIAQLEEKLLKLKSK